MLSANKIEEIKEQAFLGLPSSLDNICKVYPLKIPEIVEMGTITYNGKLGLLLLTEVDIVNIIKEKTGEEIPIEDIHPLEYLIQSAALDDMFLLELKSIFSTFLKEDIKVLPKINAILVGNPLEKRLITNENFQDLQDILRIQNKKEAKEPPPKNESAGERKMRLLREKVAAVKKKQAQKNGQEQSLVELLEIAQTFGIDIQNCTLYSFYSLIRRAQLKEKWDQDIQMLCAGADSNKLKTKYWGESLKNDE